jgi:hypothetical protein
VAANWLKDKGYIQPTAMYEAFMHSYEFYASGEPAWLATTDELKHFATRQKPCIIYCGIDKIDSLQQSGFKVKLLKDFEYYRISMLTGKFLNPATRNEATLKMALLEVSQK